MTIWRATSVSVKFARNVRLIDNYIAKSRFLWRFRKLEDRITYPSHKFHSAGGIILRYNHGLKIQGFQQGSTGWWFKFLNRSKVVPFDALAHGLAVKVLSKLPSRNWIASKWPSKVFLKTQITRSAFTAGWCTLVSFER